VPLLDFSSSCDALAHAHACYVPSAVQPATRRPWMQPRSDATSSLAWGVRAESERMAWPMSRTRCGPLQPFISLVCSSLDKAPWKDVLGEDLAILRPTSSMPCRLACAQCRHTHPPRRNRQQGTRQSLVQLQAICSGEPRFAAIGASRKVSVYSKRAILFCACLASVGPLGTLACTTCTCMYGQSQLRLGRWLFVLLLAGKHNVPDVKMWYSRRRPL
jgi:hypothetical protein